MIGDDTRFRTFLFSYRHAGAFWSIEVLAKDEDDARMRLDSIANWSQYDGEVHATIPVLPRGLRAWVRRLFR